MCEIKLNISFEFIMTRFRLVYNTLSRYKESQGGVEERLPGHWLYKLLWHCDNLKFIFFFFTHILIDSSYYAQVIINYKEKKRKILLITLNRLEDSIVEINYVYAINFNSKTKYTIFSLCKCRHTYIFVFPIIGKHVIEFLSPNAIK